MTPTDILIILGIALLVVLLARYIIAAVIIVGALLLITVLHLAAGVSYVGTALYRRLIA